MQRTKTKPKAKKSKKDRRYPVGKYPDYDFALKQALQNSPILNSSNASKINNSYLTDHPETGLLELEGDPNSDHYVKIGNEWRKGRIPKAKEDLKEVHQRFQNWQKEQVRSGKCLKPPTDWPESLLTLRLSKEGILDALIEEANTLKRKIKAREDAKEQKRLKAVLKDGPLGKTENGLIDGQKISHSADGVPFINEPTSKYKGMPIYFYKQMAEKWQKDIGVDNDSLFAERDELYIKARQEAYKQGENPPTTKQAIQKMRREKLSKISPKDFPDWPADAVPVNELTNE